MTTRTGKRDKRLKGVNRVRKPLVDGSYNEHYYLGRGAGAVAIEGEFGSNEFFENLEAARKGERQKTGTFRDIIQAFRADGLPRSPSTQRDYKRHLKRIEGAFGTSSMKSIEGKPARAEFLKFRNKVAELHGDYEADANWATLKRMLNWAILDSEFDISINRAARGGHLHEPNSRADVVWTPDDVRLFDGATQLIEHRWAVRWLIMGGMRRESAVICPWTAYRNRTIEWKPKKTRRYGTWAQIPVYRLPYLEAFLDSLPRRATTIITSSVRIGRQDDLRRPYTADGFSSSIDAVRARAGLTGDPENGIPSKRINDLRGTAVTQVIKLGWRVDEIAKMFGWRRKSAEKMCDIYGSQRHKEDVDLEEVAAMRIAS